MRKKRARRGPDPEEFWGVAWSGSLKFVRDNMKLVMRTGAYWSIFVSLSYFALCCAAVCTTYPPYVFWISAATFFFTGATGWYWTCSIKVIQHTMGPKRKKKLERFHFDFFANIALGIKAIIWPRVLFMPVVLITLVSLAIPMALASAFGFDELSQIVLFSVDGTIAFIGLLIFPLAMVHMSMPYTYKAWIPYYMAISLGKNILPALYWLMMAIAVLLPMSITLLIFHLAWEGGLDGFFRDLFAGTFDLILFLMKTIGLIKESKVGEYPYTLKIVWWAFPIFFALLYLFVLIALAPICIIYAFPAVFLMRANAYLGLYFRDKLDLVKEQTPNTICGFWPRYLALLVDWLVIGILLGVVWGIVFGAGELFVWMGLDYLKLLMIGAGGLLSIIVPWMYFAKPESMPVWQGSIGKRSIGLIVTDEDGETMTFSQATGRFFAKWYLSQLLSLGIGYVMAAFHEKKQALHDTMAGTIVVWQGDDERDIH